MRIIVNRHIPFKGFIACNLFGVLFVRSEYLHKVQTVTMCHEYIHSEQMKELLYIPFYIIYLCEYIARLAICRNSREAYRGISFEREARQHQTEPNYLTHRKHFAQWRH